MFSLNVGLERQKAKMQLQLTRTEYTPGEVINGMVIIHVLRDMKITGVRLEVRAKERCELKVKGAKRVVEDFTHFQQDITFFGFSKLSGRKGGAELSVGSYQYPFQVPIPSTAPPSYYIKGSFGSNYLDWKVKATIVIPNSPFDAKEEATITVFSAIAKKQFDELNATPYDAGSGRCAIAASNQCCGGTPGDLDVAVTTFPRAVLMHRNRTTTTADMATRNEAGATPSVQQAYPSEGGYGKRQQPEFVSEEPPSYQTGPPKDAAVPNVLTVPAESGFSDSDNTMTIRLKLSATQTDAKITKVRVTLHQYIQVSVNGHSFCDVQRIAGMNVSPPSNVIKKGRTIWLDARLDLGDMLRTDPSAAASAPLPCMATKMLESTLLVTVDFPNSDIKDEIAIDNLGYVFGVFDMSNRVPMAPARYATADVRQERILSGV